MHLVPGSAEVSTPSAYPPNSSKAGFIFGGTSFTIRMSPTLLFLWQMLNVTLIPPGKRARTASWRTSRLRSTQFTLGTCTVDVQPTNPPASLFVWEPTARPLLLLRRCLLASSRQSRVIMIIDCFSPNSNHLDSDIDCIGDELSDFELLSTNEI